VASALHARRLVVVAATLGGGTVEPARFSNVINYDLSVHGYQEEETWEDRNARVTA
jgi:hypothetical protein